MSKKSDIVSLLKYRSLGTFAAMEALEALGLELEDIDEDVDSSCISHVTRDAETGETTIDFVSGHSYTWYGLPLDLVKGLLSASSPGSYFNSEIRGRYS